MSNQQTASNFAIDQSIMDAGTVRVPLWLLGGIARNVPVIALRQGTQRFLPFKEGDTITFDNVNDPTNRVFIKHAKYEAVLVERNEVRLKCVTRFVNQYHKRGRRTW